MNKCPQCGFEKPFVPRRFVYEAIWSGYKAGQSKVCHRVIVTKSRGERLAAITGVYFTDGTNMITSLRHLKPREKVQEIHGYDLVFDKALAKGLRGWISVNDV